MQRCTEARQVEGQIREEKTSNLHGSKTSCRMELETEKVTKRSLENEEKSNIAEERSSKMSEELAQNKIVLRNFTVQMLEANEAVEKERECELQREGRAKKNETRLIKRRQDQVIEEKT